MFTGIIRHSGQLARRVANRVHVVCPSLAGELAEGDSVAVSGVCLTVAELADEGFAADLLQETLANTTLASLPEGTRLNLELPLRAGATLGGHWVQGHVDGVTEVRSMQPRPDGGREIIFSLPDWLMGQIIDRGSICIDGVSLTVQALWQDSFAVGIIPVTVRETNLGDIAPGDRVNIEADYLVKTVKEVLKKLLPAMLADRGQDASQAASQ